MRPLPSFKMALFSHLVNLSHIMTPLNIFNYCLWVTAPRGLLIKTRVYAYNSWNALSWWGRSSQLKSCPTHLLFHLALAIACWQLC